MRRLVITTDGSRRGNPSTLGPGGWACIIDDVDTNEREVLSGRETATTVNRMELTAAIRGLEALGDEQAIVDLIADSEYVVKGLNEWVPAWEKRGWRTAANKPVKNLDLWQRLLELCRKHAVTPRWVPGHAGHPDNEVADEVAQLESLLAREEAPQPSNNEE